MADPDNPLGAFLKDRRARLDPEALGFVKGRRRTPGLRREEVALRANVSATWYTWLEQGRGGTPSADVLDRLAKGLDLTGVEREHLFFLAQNRAPEVAVGTDEVDPILQSILESLETSPAVIRTAAWDAVAANRAALAVLVGGARPEGRYNILERFFDQPQDGEPWWALARSVVAQFRAESARAGFPPRAREVADGLLARSEAFRRCWSSLDVDLVPGGLKTFVLPGGSISFEYAAFAVEGRPGLTMVVYQPVSAEDRRRVQVLVGTLLA